MDKEDITRTFLGPIEKFLDVVQSALGTLYKPRSIKKMAEATADEINIVGKAISDNVNIPIKYTFEHVVIDTSDNGFLERTHKRSYYQELKKQENIENIVGYAYSEVEHDTEVSPESVDKDWITRFFNSVEDISEESMQKLWGKILADEIRKPKSFSLRTLEVLHNISANEAALFEKYCKFVLFRNEPLGVAYYKDISDIRYSELLLLEECGLFNLSDACILISVEANSIVALNERYILVADRLKEDGNIQVTFHSLTKAGKELYSLFKYSKNLKNMLEWGKNMQKKNDKFKLHLYRIKSKVNNEVNIDFEVDYLDIQ